MFVGFLRLFSGETLADVRKDLPVADASNRIKRVNRLMSERRKNAQIT